MKYKNVSIFKQEYINLKDKDLPIFIGERRMSIILCQKEEDKKIYNKFFEQLDTYVEKIPSSPAKVAVKKLIDRRLIFLGRDVTIPSKNGIIGAAIVNKNRCAGVVLDTVELEIDFETGETSNIDHCFYTSYFEFIRVAIVLNSDEIKRDRKLHELCIKYLFYICLRIIGTNINFSTKQKEFLEVLCSYFFYRFLIGMQHTLTKETIYKYISKDLKEEVDSLMPRLEKYTLMRDIFKGMIDFKLTNETPTILVMKTLSKLKPTIFYAVTSSLDYLIAIAVISKYPTQFFRNGTISNSLQSNIETSITPFINSLKFDTTSIVNL